ncbi:hypothetical protein ACH4FX_28945 [Streptomyces sp. NPDC018019]|uniref:hypothetical protein n=1 Tax=Streptomyces sp. NPDC018019 TaxID=3365030 RepID=UPI0037A7CD0E
MSDQTPSQAEGERDDEPKTAGRRGASSRDREDAPRPTPSQAEGEREEDAERDRS